MQIDSVRNKEATERLLLRLKKAFGSSVEIKDWYVTERNFNNYDTVVSRVDVCKIHPELVDLVGKSYAN